MSPRLKAALARAREGAYVIPIWWTDDAGVCRCPQNAHCPSPGKHPLTARGLHDASGDPATIEQWWRRWPEANVAVRTDDTLRIDIDLVEAAEALLADPELPSVTEVVRTPRSGLHMALRCPGVATSKLKLADGRGLGDLKATGAYVLTPPSRVGANSYELLSPEDVGPLKTADPLAWLAERLARCGLTLAHARPEPAYRGVAATVPEGGRHAALTSYAGLIWVEGIAPAAFGAALHAINRAICDPPLPAAEVDAIIQHFVERRERREAVMLPYRKSEPAAAQAAIALQSLDEWLDGDDPPLDVVLGDGKDGAILPIDGKGFIAGSTGIGKTNLLLRLGRCLVDGSPFLGRFPVPQPRTVLHVALEGSRRGLRRRLRKVWAGSTPDARGRYFLVFAQLNLAADEGVRELDRLIAETRPEVVIIDPLRNAHTWDENDSRETTLLTSTLDGIIARHRCALIAAHHDRKKPPLTKRDGGTDRIRGSTALAGWLSFCLSVEKDREPDTLIAEWTKVRDAEDGLPELLLAFDRETLDYEATERTPASKVSDEDVLAPVFHAGHDGIRGTELVEAVRTSTGASERTVRDRVRELVTQGRLIAFIADEDRVKRAKSYRLVSEEDE